MYAYLLTYMYVHINVYIFMYIYTYMYVCTRVMKKFKCESGLKGFTIATKSKVTRNKILAPLSTKNSGKR